MKNFIRLVYVAVCLAIMACALPVGASAQSALPSWNDGNSKTAIVDFVTAVTKEGGPQFVAPADRVAVFDNDGTLWSEQPYYFQLAFALDRVKALAPDHPEWKTTEPFKSILEGNLEGLIASGEKGLLEVVMATHAGMTTDEFTAIVKDWFAKSRHPRFDRPYNEIIFQPMVELLDYLRANGFRTYIVSGGGVEFMRTMTDDMYGIPPAQVVGSTIVTKYELDGDKAVLRREPRINFIDDNVGKPVGINNSIGSRPIFVAGNSDGDYEMLRWSTEGDGPRFGLIIHHTDAEREWAYDRDSHIGKLAKALDEAAQRKWLVVDMKNDWGRIYPFDK